MEGEFNSYQTEVHYNGGRSAVWSNLNKFSFPIKSATEILFIKVMDYNNLVAHRLIGQLKIQCTELGPESFERWFTLDRPDGAAAGDILLNVDITS